MKNECAWCHGQLRMDEERYISRGNMCGYCFTEVNKVPNIYQVPVKPEKPFEPDIITSVYLNSIKMYEKKMISYYKNQEKHMIKYAYYKRCSDECVNKILFRLRVNAWKNEDIVN